MQRQQCQQNLPNLHCRSRWNGSSSGLCVSLSGSDLANRSHHHLLFWLDGCQTGSNAPRPLIIDYFIKTWLVVSSIRRRMATFRRWQSGLLTVWRTVNAAKVNNNYKKKKSAVRLTLTHTHLTFSILVSSSGTPAPPSSDLFWVPVSLSMRGHSKSLPVAGRITGAIRGKRQRAERQRAAHVAQASKLLHRINQNLFFLFLLIVTEREKKMNGKNGIDESVDLPDSSKKKKT